jgi:hypothetical protein
MWSTSNHINSYHWMHAHTFYRIDAHYVIKVADFGLAESIGTKEYFRQDKTAFVKLPMKWMAPESFHDYIFTEKSDVVNTLLYLVTSQTKSCTEL